MPTAAIDGPSSTRCRVDSAERRVEEQVRAHAVEMELEARSPRAPEEVHMTLLVGSGYSKNDSSAPACRHPQCNLIRGDTWGGGRGVCANRNDCGPDEAARSSDGRSTEGGGVWEVWMMQSEQKDQEVQADGESVLPIVCNSKCDTSAE